MSTTGVTNDQASAYGARGSTRSSAGTAPIHHGSGVGLRSSSVPLRIATPSSPCVGEPRELGVRRPAPGRDLVLREGEVGVPDRGRDARRRLQREVAREDVDPVAGLEQPEGAAEADDPRADDDHPVRHAAESAAPGRFPAREDRGRALPGRLRRTAHRPPADGDPGADDQGRRLGARALRRRLLQAAELDVAALHPARGHDRRRRGRCGRSRSKDRRHPADPDRGGPQRHLPRPRHRPRAAEGRRREAPPGAAGRAPRRRWPTA